MSGYVLSVDSRSDSLSETTIVRSGLTGVDRGTLRSLWLGVLFQSCSSACRKLLLIFTGEAGSLDEGD